jgi:hypothetical protein
MIDRFVKVWDDHKQQLRHKYEQQHPDDYNSIVKDLVTLLAEHGDTYSYPDPERITQIDHGHYQGTLLFVVAAGGYQPSTFWATKVDYGSCSGCDTLEAITCYSTDPPTEKQTNDYMTLALHLLQSFKEI